MGELLLVVLHVFFNFLWIGGMAAVAFLLHTSHSAVGADAKELASASARSAAALYRGPASIGFYGSFTFGLLRLLLEPKTYMHAHWFHGKLTLALVVIGLHHVLGAHAKKVAGGSRQAGTRGAILGLAFLASALLAAGLAVFKAVLVP